MEIVTVIASVATFILLVMDIKDRRRERAEVKKENTNKGEKA